MPQATKLASDVLWYWHLMQKYRKALSLTGQRYVLEIEMAQFLTECTNPRVERLLTEFMRSEKAKLGITIPKDIA